MFFFVFVFFFRWGGGGGENGELSFFQRSNIHFITPLLFENLSYQRVEEIMGIMKGYLLIRFCSMSKHTIR